MRFRSKSRLPPTHNQGVLGSSPSGTTDNQVVSKLLTTFLCQNTSVYTDCVNQRVNRVNRC